MSVGTVAVPAPRLLAPRQAGWIGGALAITAWLITLPPLLVRSPAGSIVLAIAAVGAGAWAFVGGERRVGLGTAVAGVLAGVLAVVATKSGVGNLQTVFSWSALIAAMLRFATPLLFAALGGIVSERGGVINIGLEGMMLTGAFFGIWGADVLGSWLLGIVVAMVAGGLLALVHGVFSIHMRADQVVSGTAVNFLAIGITGYFFVAHYGNGGTPNDVSTVPDVSLPVIANIGFLGQAIDRVNLLTWVALLIVPALTFFLFRTSSGLRLRAVGEKPRAADTVGVSVIRTRYLAVTASGMLAALGGAYLSVAFVGSFNQNMTAGRGFIALAAVIFGKWRPAGTLAATLLFGLSSALAFRLPAFSASTATLFQTLPYVLTLVAVAGFIGRSRAPGSIGIPYVKE